ncbi:MAG: hypothetical protein WHT06_06030 [Desulfobacterales bacterium]
MADSEAGRPPDCFGRLERVFPLGEDGLRHSPPACLACVCKTACLRRALEGRGGARVHEERLRRAWEAGTMPFWERWARKKTLHAAAAGPAGGIRGWLRRLKGAGGGAGD